MDRKLFATEATEAIPIPVLFAAFPLGIDIRFCLRSRLSPDNGEGNRFFVGVYAGHDNVFEI